MKKFNYLFAALLFSLTSMGSAMASFTDVPSSHPNYEAINYVQSKGIVEGYPGGTYQPDKLIDRYEFTKIIVGAAYSPAEIEACKTSPFKDVQMNQWFTPFVCLAEKEGIVDGYEDGTFQGTNDIKIVEAAKIIVNGFKYPVTSDAIWYKPFLLKLEEMKALPTTLNNLEHKVTRGEMAEMIDRLMEKITTKSSTTYNEMTGEVLENNYTTAQITEMAINYHNMLIDKENVALDEYEAYTTLADNTDLDGDFTALEKERVKATQAIKLIQIQISGLGAFRGDDTLKVAVVKDLGSLIEVLNNEEKKLIELWVKMSKVNGELPQSYLDEETALFDAINQKAEDASKAFEMVQDAFAKKYNFTLDQVADNFPVVDYNNKVVNFQKEALDLRQTYIDLADSIPLDKGDFKALDDKREDTIDQINTLKAELKKMEGYNGDTALRDAFVKNIESIVGTLENEEKQLIDIWVQMAADPDNISQNLIDQEDSVLQTIEVKDDQAYEALTMVQQAFAKKYDYTIEN